MGGTRISTELQTLMALAKEQGWRIETTSQGHLQWHSPDPNQEFIATSRATDTGIVNTIRSQLKGAGLIVNRDEWKSIKRKRRRIENLRKDRYSGPGWIEALRDILDDPTVQRPGAEAMGWFMASLTLDNGNDKLNKFLNERVTGDFVQLPTLPAVCQCGHRANAPLALAIHCYNPETHFAKPGHEPIWTFGDIDKENLAMDRDPDERPPDRDRMDCPECDFYCWITQPHLMDAHLEEDHELKMCPGCKRVMKLTSIDRHMTDSCPVLNPIKPPIKRGKNFVPRPVERTPFEDIGKAYQERVTADRVLTPDDQAMIKGMMADAASTLTGPVVPPAPVQLPAPTQPAPTPPAATQRPVGDPSEEELFALLELVLDGPVLLDAATWGAVQSWMDATKVLLRIRRDQQGGE